MTVQLTIIGLGKIGASVGLALAKHADLLARRGNDINHSIARQALKLGAVDKIEVNLPAAVEKADIILLAIPLDQIQETLEIIASEVKENVVIMDTSPSKTAVGGWVKGLLPEHCHYVGLVPVFNPTYLDDTASGVENARADLFEKGLMAITSDDEALKLGADFVALLGATPLFTDATELDGFLAAVHTLPGLAAAALTNAIVNTTGWTDRQKLAGNVFAASTALAVNSTAQYEEAISNRENTVRVLDDLIAELMIFRDQLIEEDAGLKKRLVSASRSREGWLKERKSGNWLTAGMNTPQMPKFRDHLKQLVGDPARLFGSRRKSSQDDIDNG
jgi:prephenate dehydrogenase